MQKISENKQQTKSLSKNDAFVIIACILPSTQTKFPNSQIYYRKSYTTVSFHCQFAQLLLIHFAFFFKYSLISLHKLKPYS